MPETSPPCCGSQRSIGNRPHTSISFMSAMISHDTHTRTHRLEEVIYTFRSAQSNHVIMNINMIRPAQGHITQLDKLHQGNIHISHFKAEVCLLASSALQKSNQTDQYFDFAQGTDE